MKSRSIMFIAGEDSGDMHAARLLADMRRLDPSLSAWGIGGDRLAAEGAELLHHTREMAVMGLTEVLKRYFFFRRVFHEMLRLAEVRRPDLVVLVDYPGFNLRLARKLHDRGFRIVYYICPQVWAWKRSRIPVMAEILDRLLVIFPFETEVFAGTRLPVAFVGHPLVEAAAQARLAPPVPLPWRTARRVALLPGSRRHEIQRILPIMLETAALMLENHNDLSFIVAASSDEIVPVIQDVIAQSSATLPLEIVAGQTRQILRQAHCAMVASGTATIETALQHCPMIVVYKTARLTFALAKLLVRGVKHIGMVNIVAQKLLCPEFIQRQARPDLMAAALDPLLGDTPARTAMIEGLKQIEARLGRPADPLLAARLALDTAKQ